MRETLLSLRTIGEDLTLELNEALQLCNRSTLSTYVQEDVEKVRSVLLCIQDVLNYILEADFIIEVFDDDYKERIASYSMRSMKNWMEKVGQLAKQVSSQVQELVSQVEGGNAQMDKEDHRVSNSYFASVLDSNNYTIFEIKKTRTKLAGMLYGKGLSKSGYRDKKSLGLDSWMLLERARGSSSNLHNECDKCYGRDGDVDTLIHYMLFHFNEGVDLDDGGQIEVVVEEPIVVSIVGMLGIGKTALAHLIFNDKRVMRYFYHRVWVGELQNNFDVSGIIESIIRSTTSDAAVIGSSSDSLPHLQQTLRGKRLLLVLDGVWKEVGEKWSELKALLRTSGYQRGSCILITTRFEEVARKMDARHLHYLKPLSEDDCWSLFAERAFWGTSKDKCSELMEYGSNFMKRGGGVPLFVNALGCYWRSVKIRQRWIHDSQNRKLDIPPPNYGKVVARTLYDYTYTSLPSNLERCFKICLLFPTNSWIEKDTMIQIWMALDSIWQYGTYSQYFDDLLANTSFFKDLERDDVDGTIIRCRMRAPPHDLAVDMQVVLDDLLKKLSAVRHLSLVCKRDAKSINNILDTDRTLQSLLIFGNPTNLKVSSDIFDRFHFLKILDLGESGVTELPDSLWNLRDLRYLNLSFTKIRKLPKSIRGLHTLEILKLSYSGLLELPKEISLLTNLIHLEIEGTCKKFLPKGIERLTNLQKLTEFIIGVQKGCSIQELGNLNLLQGKLVISNLNKLANRSEAQEAKLNEKDHLNWLVLDGNEHFNYHRMDLNKHFSSKGLQHLHGKTIKFKRSKESTETVFEGLKPHENLKRLEIWNYIGGKLPSWMEKPLPSIVFLRLAKCGMVELLPPLGLFPYLKHLHIHGMDKLKHLGHELYGEGKIVGFPKLECLIFEEMSSWEKWDLRLEKGEMPCLTKLILRQCSMLVALPRLPGALIELELHDCSKLETLTSLPKALQTFTLCHCHMLKILPDLPTPMRKLVLVDCTSLTVLPRLPKALFELVIRDCSILEPVQHLSTTSIRELGVSNWSVLVSPPELPDTLKVLNIYDYSEPKWNPETPLLQLEHLVLASKDRSLKSLPKFPKLVSLKIMMSPELASLPGEWLIQLSTLKTLSIHFCPKLKYLPEELKKLTSLQKLFIVGCRQLKEQCHMEKGQDWHKIAHVPYIKIEDKIQSNWMQKLDLW